MNAWFNQHRLALRDALRRIGAAPLGTLLSLLVIGIALTLPAGGWLLLDNLQRTMNGAGRHQISVFLAADAGRKASEEVEARLKAAPPGRWRFVSREDALRQLQGGNDLGGLVAGLSKNPLPDAFVIDPADNSPAAMDGLAKSIRTWPHVAHVQLDSAWVKRFDAFLHVGRLTVSLLAAIFAAGLVLTTFNTIRLQVLAHGAEIEVARLIGATDGWIRRPFAYHGALQGALGGLMSVGLLALGKALLDPALGELARLYGTDFSLGGLSPMLALQLIGIGATLGWLGALLSVRMSLRS